jgi:hypothetical protein
MLKHVVLVLGLLLPMLLLPVTVAAGRTATLDLVSERWTTYAPTQCYHEDSLHERAWAGTLAAGQSLTIPLRFCDYTAASGGVGPGGDAFMAGVSGRGALALTVTSPSGTVYQSHSWPSAGGKTSAWRKCATPPQMTAYDTMIGTIEPGVWTVMLRNTGARSATDITLLVNVMMPYGWWQQQNCPPADQSLRV